MAKQNKAVKAQSGEKSRAKVKRTVVEELSDDLAGLAKLPGGPIAAAGGGTIQAQAARLSEGRLQGAQRRALAAQIGRVQGNRHLQRVIASIKGEAKRAPYSSHTSKPPSDLASGTVMKKSANGLRPSAAEKADTAKAVGEAILTEGLGSSGPPTMAAGEPLPADGRTSATGGGFIEAQAARFGAERPYSAQRQYLLHNWGRQNLEAWKMDLFSNLSTTHSAPGLSSSYQRRALATQIERGQDNQHFQMVGASLERDGKTAYPTPACQQVPGAQAVQRSAQGPVELDEETTARINRERGGEQSLSSAVQAQMKAASFGNDLNLIKYLGEKPLSGAFATYKTDPMKAASFGNDVKKIKYLGEKSVPGFQAQWRITRDIKAHGEREKVGAPWFMVLDKFDLEREYWLNSDATWYTSFEKFPGGRWQDGEWFNTKMGSKIHECAELQAVGKAWKKAEKNIKEGIKKGFKTQKKMNANYIAVNKKEFAIFAAEEQAIRKHKNPVGPVAEWNYYSWRSKSPLF